MSTETKGKFIQFVTDDGTWYKANVISVERLKGAAADGLDAFQVTFILDGRKYTKGVTYLVYSSIKHELR